MVYHVLSQAEDQDQTGIEKFSDLIYSNIFLIFSGTERFHPVNNHTLVHTGQLKKRFYAKFMCTNPPEYYRCCNKDKGEEGCTDVWACCGKEVEKEHPPCQQRFICCKMNIGKHSNKVVSKF